MLCSRRLLLPQASLSRWKTSAPSTASTVAARRAYARPPRPPLHLSESFDSLQPKDSNRSGRPTDASRALIAGDAGGGVSRTEAVPSDKPSEPTYWQILRSNRSSEDSKPRRPFRPFRIFQSEVNKGPIQRQPIQGEAISNSHVRKAVDTAEAQPSKVTRAWTRQAALNAAGKTPLAFGRDKEIPHVQPQASDFFATSLPDALQDPEPSTAELGSGASTTRADAVPLGIPFGSGASTTRADAVPLGIPFGSGASTTRADAGPLGIPFGSRASTTRTLGKPSDPNETSASIYGMLFPSIPDYGTPSPKVEVVSKPKAKRHGLRDVTVKKISGGIFARLFPDEHSKQSEPTPEETPPPSKMEAPEETSPSSKMKASEHAVFESLRNEILKWVPAEERGDMKGERGDLKGGLGAQRAVVIVYGLANTLVDTDFYRLLPQAKHIEGWAGGLAKVVQARHRLSHEPIGQYYLMFHSRAAADAYKAEALRLHQLSKRLLHSTSGSGLLDDAPVEPQMPLTKDEQHAVRAFTLCPPTAALRINVRPFKTSFLRDIALHTNISDVVQNLRPDQHTPAKVLVSVNAIPGARAGSGGGLSVEELFLTLRDDGRERGAPWVLTNLKEGIKPVKLFTLKSYDGHVELGTLAVEPLTDGSIYDEVDMVAEHDSGFISARKVTHDDEYTDVTRRSTKVKPNEKFHKFMITFAQRTASRRFVRSWHKRSIWDAIEQRSVFIDAVVLS